MSRRNFNGIVKKERCCNCGRQGDDLMFHHIVPVSMGGNDIETNIAVICPKCHSIIHGKKIVNANRHYGRPAEKLDAEKVRVLQMWASKRIGTNECKMMLGKTKGFRITTSNLFKRALKEGLIRWDGKRNGLDVSEAKLKKKRER